MDSDTIFQDAGLIDANGAPTSAPNFGAAPEPDRDADVFSAADLGDTAETATPAATTPAATQPETFEPLPQARTTVTPQQAHALGSSIIQQQYQEALVYGLSLRDQEGRPLYSIDQLHQQMAPMREQMSARLETDVVKHQMAPYAQRMAAEHIAKQHGIKVADILDGSSPEVMEDRARTIAKLTRDNRVQNRAANRTDAVEGGRGMSNTASEAYQNLSPTQKIKFGLMRGDS